jgi:hypothetical protein
MAMIKRAVDAGLTNAAKTHKELVNANWSRSGRLGSSTPGSPPGVRTARLRNSLVATPGRNGHSSSGVAKGVPYARILELGGTIRARRSYLTVPVNQAAKRLSEKGLASYGKMFTFRSKKGNVILMGTTKVRSQTTPGRGVTIRDNSIPVFVLKKSITLRARPYLRPRAKDPSIAVAARRAATAYIRANSATALGGAR